jgi:transcriptional regulator with XRE-family HTH domain
MKEFNKKFRLLRNHLGLTQKEFAVMLKMTQANVSQIENGVCLPTGETLVRLHDAIPDLDFNWLVKGQSGSPIKSKFVYDGFFSEKSINEEKEQKNLFD